MLRLRKEDCFKKFLKKANVHIINVRNINDHS